MWNVALSGLHSSRQRLKRCRCSPSPSRLGECGAQWLRRGRIAPTSFRPRLSHSWTAGPLGSDLVLLPKAGVLIGPPPPSGRLRWIPRFPGGSVYASRTPGGLSCIWRIGEGDPLHGGYLGRKCQRHFPRKRHECLNHGGESPCLLFVGCLFVVSSVVLFHCSHVCVFHCSHLAMLGGVPARLASSIQRVGIYHVPVGSAVPPQGSPDPRGGSGTDFLGES